jgi:hypothetical protein
MLGLWIAAPMTLCGSMILVRIAKLSDSVQEQMGELLHEMELVLKS